LIVKDKKITYLCHVNEVFGLLDQIQPKANSIVIQARQAGNLIEKYEKPRRGGVFNN